MDLDCQIPIVKAKLDRAQFRRRVLRSAYRAVGIALKVDKNAARSASP